MPLGAAIIPIMVNQYDTDTVLCHQTLNFTLCIV